MKIRKDDATEFAVLGLGRFGQSLVKSLSEYGMNVLACDEDEEKVHAVADYATHVAKVDVTDEEALANLGLGNFDVVIVAIGEDFESSLMAVMSAKDLGVKYVVAKAYGARAKKIYKSIGVDLVVEPEQEMGEKVAHRLIRPNIIDVLEDTQHYQITEMRPMPEWVGKSVRESDIHNKHRTTLLAIIRHEKTIIPVMPEDVLAEGDVLVALCDVD